MAPHKPQQHKGPAAAKATTKASTATRVGKAKAAPVKTSITVAGQGGPAGKLMALQRSLMNQVELRTNAQDIWAKIHKNRPKNTKKAYDGKAREFVDWCEGKRFANGFMAAPRSI
ncbi:hypothetical protein B0H67DRAFT_588568 [Lasiosphaeris hirsuta]|uniref:Uncharacterized protein n=1 Tax=Lasiosphaeris hirsuta TaxID=260670 RepID=A0AA40DNY3_9PEZI|nr:hypothetical protein B0H67DRAFT_588568 [Lasiosphaeris hirsuta]